MIRISSERSFPAPSLCVKCLHIFILALALVALSGIETASAGKKGGYESDLVSTFFSPYKSSRKDMQKYTDLMSEINERNAAVEDSQEWIEEAYKGLKIRSLYSIPKEEYSKYAEYAGDNRRIYIIVHPAYYTFFGSGNMASHPLLGELLKLNKVISKGGPYPEKNLVERLYDKGAFEETLYVMQEQERLLRDFVEGYSTKGALMLLILPRDYQEGLVGYKEGYDEFARYINEITNESDSVIYMYSSSIGSGDLFINELDMLMDFLEETKIKTIVLGGGYVGRCLEGFYNTMIDAFGYNHIYMVPEIVAVSPTDIRGDWGANLLTKSGHLNLPRLHRNLLTDGAYDLDRTRPKLKHFYMYRFLKAKLAREDGERLNNGD
jgi:hypothetical protein